MLDQLRETCWNCNRPVWVCDLKHASIDLAIGAAWGSLTGAVIGAGLALLHNLMGVL